MFSTLRTRFGIPGVISVIALVFAMFGGAYAASNSAGGGKATASAKAKKGPRGPKGATGPAGPQGPAGANGKDGAAGANGAPGASGAGVTSSTVGTSGDAGHCVGVGGTKFVSGASITYACNGAAGADGADGLDGTDGTDGSPWTDGGTLPVGAKETGTWQWRSTGGVSSGQELPTNISFAIPLPAELPEGDVHYLVEDEETGEYVDSATLVAAPACDDGSAADGPPSAANPEADPGHLCVYHAYDGSGQPNFVSIAKPNILALTGAEQKGSGISGAVLIMKATIAAPSLAAGGTFAVTGFNPPAP